MVLVACAICLLIMVSLLLAFHHPNDDVSDKAPILTILGRTNEAGRQVVVFELQVPSGRRIVVKSAYLGTDWGTSIAHHGPPLWVRGTDPTGKLFEPGTESVLYIVEPSQRLRQLQLETIEVEWGPHSWSRKWKLLWQTKNPAVLSLNLPLLPMKETYVRSGLISSYASESDGAANRIPPVPPVTH